MDMNLLKEVIIMIALVALIGGAAGIALDDFQDTLGEGAAVANCGVNGSAQFNMTCNGLTGILNSSAYLGTIGTIAGVAVLIGLVIGAFYLIRR